MLYYLFVKYIAELSLLHSFSIHGVHESISSNQGCSHPGFLGSLGPGHKPFLEGPGPMKNVKPPA